MLRMGGRHDSSVVMISEVRHQWCGRQLLQQGGGGSSSFYCVASPNADVSKLQTALDWACGSGPGQGNVDCSAIQSGGSCYNPNAITNHASYAFDLYYSKQNGASSACNFNGLATLTQTSPSSGTCVYPSSSSGATSSSNTTTTTTPPTTPTTSPPSPSSTTISPPSSSSNTTLSPPFGDTPPDNITTNPTASASPSAAPSVPFASLHWLQTFVCMLVVILLSSSKW